MKRVWVAHVRDKSERVRSAIGGEVEFQWIYAGQDIRQLTEWELKLEGVASHQPMGSHLQVAADDLSHAFNDFIDCLGRRHDSLGWWMGQIAEKNPHVSQLFLQICYLKSITDVIGKSHYSNWLVVVNNGQLGQALVLCAKQAGWVVKTISGVRMKMVAALSIVVQIARDLRSKSTLVQNFARLRYWSKRLCHVTNGASSTPHNQKKTILIHSWLRNDCVGQKGEFVDRFFGVLPEKLQNLNYDIQYLVLPATIISQWSSTLKTLRILWQRNLLFPIHKYLKWIDVLKALFIPHLICNVPKGEIWFRDWNISALVAGERRKQVWSSRTSDAYLFYALTKQLGKAGVCFERVVHTSENHVWEKALCLGIHSNGVANKSIGFQHSAIPWNYHCLSPGSYECGTDVLTDVLTCSGRFWASCIREKGYPSVVTGGAFRSDDLTQTSRRSLVSDQRIILAAANAYIPHTLDMLRAIYLAMREDDSRKIWIKLHPDFPLRADECQQVFTGGMPAHFEFVTKPLSQLFDRVGLVVYCSSAICVDALARGIPILSVVPETAIDLDPMRWFPSFRRAAGSPEDLRKEVNIILSMSSSEQVEWEQSARQIAERVLAPVTPESINACLV